jgi:REP element-mobilizing transposase RayT
MSKRPPYQPGSYYHIYNRGRSRLSICHDKSDYFDILKKLRTYSLKYSIAIIAYVLLPNHYHFLVRQDALPRASLLPQRIFNSYSKIYNLKYTHSGTLFEGSAKAKIVTTEAYLLHLCRYIHANPVLHGITRTLDEWPYSNYPEWIGTRHGALVNRAFITDHFSTPAAYREFVIDYLRERTHPDGFEHLLDWD